MIEIEAEISTREGRLPTFIVRPDEGGPHPIVIIYMDALGIREELRDMSRRIASCGYYVMLPNLFYRWGGPSFDPKPLASGVVDPLMIELNELLSMAMTAEDSASLLDHAAADGAARMLVATIGYCMGGRISGEGGSICVPAWRSPCHRPGRFTPPKDSIDTCRSLFRLGRQRCFGANRAYARGRSRFDCARRSLASRVAPWCAAWLHVSRAPLLR